MSRATTAHHTVAPAQRKVSRCSPSYTSWNALHVERCCTDRNIVAPCFIHMHCLATTTAKRIPCCSWVYLHAMPCHTKAECASPLVIPNGTRVTVVASHTNYR